MDGPPESGVGGADGCWCFKDRKRQVFGVIWDNLGRHRTPKLAFRKTESSLKENSSSRTCSRKTPKIQQQKQALSWLNRPELLGLLQTVELEFNDDRFSFCFCYFKIISEDGGEGLHVMPSRTGSTTSIT